MNCPLSKQIFFLGLFLKMLFAGNTIEQTIQSAEIVINAFTGVESRAGTEHQHLTPHLHQIALYGHTLPEDVKNFLKEVGFDFSGNLVTRGRPNLDYHYDIDSIRLHYNLTGIDSVSNIDISGEIGVPDYVEQMANVFTEVYNVEINDLGYDTPPPEDGIGHDDGGSNHYDVYINNLPSNYYGLVQGDGYGYQGSGGIIALVSYMEMRNNYNGFYSPNNDYGPTTELEAIQVTAAHEYFHAIQYGYDGYEEPWLLEATATWIEEIVYDDINDCYQYMPNWFNSPHKSLGTQMYGSYIFYKYIDEHFGGSTTIRHIFEEGLNTNSQNGDYSIQAVDDGLKYVNSSFEEVLNNMVIANRILSSDPGFGAEIYSYEEADAYQAYPVDGPNTYRTVNFSAGDIVTVSSTNLQKYASQYIKVNTETPVNITLTGHESDLKLHVIIKMETGSHLVRSGSPINIDPSIGVEWISLAVVSQDIQGSDWDYELAIEDGEPENYPPSEFSIITPADSSIIDTSFVTFLWNKAIDLDENDIVFYDVELGPNIQNLDTVYTGTDTTFSKNLSNNTIYHWRVKATDIANNVVYNNEGIYTFMIQMDDIAEKVVLSHPYPNPFPASPVNSTRVKLVLEESQVISIKIVNILGQEVAKLFSGELSAGFYDHLSWDGKMGNGKKAPSGIYFILVEGDQFHTWQKVTLLR